MTYQTNQDYSLNQSSILTLASDSLAGIKLAQSCEYQSYFRQPIFITLFVGLHFLKAHFKIRKKIVPCGFVLSQSHLQRQFQGSGRHLLFETHAINLIKH